VDANGTTLTGAHQYVIHFAANGTPPVNAFWSITMYNSRNFLVSNALDRYAISPHLGNLTYNADGSLDIYIQNTSPGPAKQANWLPAPPDAFHLVMRLLATGGCAKRFMGTTGRSTGGIDRPKLCSLCWR